MTFPMISSNKSHIIPILGGIQIKDGTSPDPEQEQDNASTQ